MSDKPQTVSGEPILRTQGLTKRFGGLVAVSDVSLDLHVGEIHVVIGPNGAGKSTLLKAILGLVPLQRGRIEILGRSPQDARRDVAYVPQSESLDPEFPISALGVVLMGRYREVGWVRRPSRADRRPRWCWRR